MEDKGLHNLRPTDGSTKARKRVGRGPASGTGKTAGRGTKGQKSRSGSHNMRPGFEGGQMPIYMRIGKLRGSTHKMSMPMGPFRTYSQPVNVGDLGGFDAGTRVTPELLHGNGLTGKVRVPVKILGTGDVEVALTVVAHGFSASARQKIEAAGGTCELVPGPKPHGRVAAALEKRAAKEAARSGGGASAPAASADGPAEDATPEGDAS